MSAKGLQQSAGIMVNYLYRLADIEDNHEAYRGEGEVAAGSAVRHLTRQALTVVPASMFLAGECVRTRRGAAGAGTQAAGVAELVDALDLGSSDENRGGSNPSARTSAAPKPGRPSKNMSSSAMQVTETNADGLKHEFKIVIPAGELETQITRRLDQLGRQIRLPGFRPGKVPQSLLRQRYGNAVRGEVLESTVQGSSAEAIRERNLRPALQPKVEIVSADEGADLEYTMSVEVLPDLPQPNFAELGLERLVVEIPDADVDQAVARMAEQFRKSEAVTRAAKSGDILVADVIGKVGDQEIPGTKAEGTEYRVGGRGAVAGLHRAARQGQGGGEPQRQGRAARELWKSRFRRQGSRV